MKLNEIFIRIISKLSSNVAALLNLVKHYWNKKAELKSYKKEYKRNKKLFKQYKRLDESRLLVIIIIIAVVIISLTNIVVLVFLIRNNGDLSSQDIIASELLNNGLSIIGIAISVWAGLNIIQLLGKNRLNEIIKQHTQFEAERRELYKKEFLNELKLQDRATSQYFCRRFRNATDKVDNIPASVYYRLYVLEINYENVYSKQAETIRKFDEFNRMTLSSEISGIIREISDFGLCEENYKVIIEYLKSRIAELNFNFGYDDSEDFILESIHCFKNTIIEYENIYHIGIKPQTDKKNMFDGNNVSQNLYTIIKQSVDRDLSKRYVAHVINTIAESHSKIAHKFLKIRNNPELKMFNISWEEAEDNISTALFLYEQLFEWNKEKNIKFEEFVYRNYAVAQERYCQLHDFHYDLFDEKEKEIIKSIRDYYKMAIEKELSSTNSHKTKEAVFQTNGSLFAKVVGNIDIWKVTDLPNKREIEQWTDEVYGYMKTAVLLFPKKLVYYKMLGIVLTYKLMFLINRRDMVSIERYNYMLLEVYKKLELEYRGREKDKYVKMIDMNLSYIKKRI